MFRPLRSASASILASAVPRAAVPRRSVVLPAPGAQHGRRDRPRGEGGATIGVRERRQIDLLKNQGLLSGLRQSPAGQGGGEAFFAVSVTVSSSKADWSQVRDRRFGADCRVAEFYYGKVVIVRDSVVPRVKANRAYARFVVIPGLRDILNCIHRAYHKKPFYSFQVVAPEYDTISTFSKAEVRPHTRITYAQQYVPVRFLRHRRRDAVGRS